MMNRPFPSGSWCVSAMLCAFLTPGMVQAQQPRTPDYSREPFVVERITSRRSIEADGRGVFERRVRVRIQSDAGVRSFGEVTFPYNASSEHLVFSDVAVHKTDGRTVTAGADAVQDRSDPVTQDAPVFTNYREKVVTVPALQPGDTLEFDIIDSTVAPTAPGHAWFAYRFDTASVVLAESLTVDAPASLYLKVKTGRTPAVVDSGTTGPRRWYRWVTAHRTMRSPESQAPATRRARPGVPAVQVTTFRSWDQIARWYDSLAAPRAAVTPAVRSEALALTAGLRDDTARVRALYDFVSTHIRYVSLSFGLGAYQPHSADDVLANQYGDCKDKHTLLAALLSAVNLRSDPVIISTTTLLDRDLPSPLQFDHLISLVHVGKDSLWLDTTPEVAPFRHLIYPIRDKDALDITATGGARIVRTPREPPTPSFQRTVVHATVDALGRLTARIQLTARGDGEVALRSIFRRLPSTMWSQVMRSVAQRLGAEAQVDSVTTDDPTATARPFTVSFQTTIPGFFEGGNRQSRIRVPLWPIDIPDSTVQVGSDTTAIALNLAGNETDSLTLILPTGFAIQPPVPVKLSRDYAVYTSSYLVRGDTLVAARAVQYLLPRLPRTRGQDLAAFDRSVKQEEDQDAGVDRAAGTDSLAALPAVAPQELYDAALAAHRRFNYHLAARLLQGAIAADTGKHAAWKVELASVYLALYRADSAEGAARLALADDPYVRNGENDLGLALWGQRRYREAADAFNKELEASPLESWVYSNLGRMYSEEHLDSLALDAFQAAARIDSRNATLHVNLARELLVLGRPDLAAAHFDTATDLSGGSMWNDIAYALAEGRTQLDKADTYVDRSLSTTLTTLEGADPAHPNFQTRSAVRSLAAEWDTKGWIAYQRGDLATAEKYVRASWALGQHAEVGDHLARIALQRGDRGAAARIFAEALVATPPYIPTPADIGATSGLQKEVDTQSPHAAADLKGARTIALGQDSGVVGSAEFDITLDQSGRARGIQFLSGDHRLEGMQARLQNASYPVVVPDTTTFFLPRRGLVTCAAAGCSVVLEDPDWVPFIQN